MLDEIFGHRPELESVGVDVVDLDAEFLETACSVSDLNDSEQSEFIASCDEIPTNTKHSYHNVVKNFSNEWRETQLELLQSIQEHDEELLATQLKKQEDMLDKNMKNMEKIIEKHREETSQILKEFLKAVQPASQYVFQPPLPTYFIQQPTSNNTRKPDVTPQDPLE